MANCVIGGNVEDEKSETLSDWVYCICVVTFDLEYGQAMELVYPDCVKLSEEDKTNLCYLAFPDSNSGCMGDTQFHVKIKCSQQLNLSQTHINYNAKCPVFLQVDQHCLFGFVFFRQIKDLTLPRGYFQKSVIILCQLPFISLFTEVCGTIAPEYFKHGITGIEVAWHDIQQWPQLYAGETVSLPLLGIVLQAQLICDNKICNSSNSVVPIYQFPIIVSSLYELNMFGCFSSIVSQIHILWELVLTTEPIVVIATSPTICSQIVQALVGLIIPLVYNGDYRPYFTIHDNEFKEYMSKSLNPLPRIIIGVTNPYFSKTLNHWPHIVKVTDTSKKDSPSQLRTGSNLKLLDVKSTVYTEYKPYLHKDKSIVKKLFRGIQNKRPEEVQSALLRRHFLELTQSFMIPLERYLSSLMPLQKNISPFRSAPKPWPFNSDKFLASLEHSGPQLTCEITGDWKGLYKQFLKSPNFNGWYNIRYKGMLAQLQILQIEALSKVDFNSWIDGKQEVEIVDMILKIRQKLYDCENKSTFPFNKKIKEELQLKMDDIICSLPDDLKNVLSNKNSSNS